LRGAVTFWLGLVPSAAFVVIWGPPANPQTMPAPLALERTIPLAGVKGRIDHMTVDLTHQKLFVAALGNGTVEAIDLAKGEVVGHLIGLSEPQGLAYLPGRDELVVATGDGSVSFYRAADLTLVGRIKLGDDADNVRVDPANGHVLVGYGVGALAVVDPASRKVIATLPLPAHPESFRIDAQRRRVFVNLPGAGQIAIGDLATMKVTASRKAAHAANYPMIYDPAANTVTVVYRLPSRLVTTEADTGRVIQDVAVCGDADDVFQDAKRRRLYVSCGSGELDVLEGPAGAYRKLVSVKTRPGARTSFFAPELDRLFVAVRSDDGKDAAILVFRPEG
jgi:DNA-binding beta-propeller fold protein YncE